MFRNTRLFRLAGAASAPLLFALSLFVAPHAAQAWTFKVLHHFAGKPGDGAFPAAGLIQDAGGNLYGTTAYGGAYDWGSAFKLAPDGVLTLLHSFNDTYDGSDGCTPYGGLIRDRAGNLYGTTSDEYCGYGKVFKLAPDNTESILHVFSGWDGAYPLAALIEDRAGTLYGTTSEGGGDNTCWYDIGCGAVFKITQDGSFTMLHAFVAANYEAAPMGGLVMDHAGNLYGTTQGLLSALGSVFELAPDGAETVLHRFGGGDDGYWPEAGVARDRMGNLYGTTYGGGQYDLGTIFALAPDGTKKTLHDFRGRDGENPYAGVIRTREGDLYGTTLSGGRYANGMIYDLKPDGTFKVLHSFNCAQDGCQPYAGLLKDDAGNLYGTTVRGGTYDDGTVFELVR